MYQIGTIIDLYFMATVAATFGILYGPAKVVTLASVNEY